MDVPSWLRALNYTREPTLHPLAPDSELLAWHVEVRFRLWQQPEESPPLTRESTYGWKPQIIGSDGSRSVGEVELVQRLRRAGMRSYWIDTFGSAPAQWQTFIAKRDQFPARIARFLADLRGKGRGKLGGAPDVIAWNLRNEEPVFVEYKGPKDKIRPGQDEWLRSALAHGLPLESYAVAKWDGVPDSAADPAR